jgi:hypothetical protein
MTAGQIVSGIRKLAKHRQYDVVSNERDGSLVLRPFFADELRLEPVGGRRFIGTEYVAASHILLGDETTGYALSTGLRNYRKTSRAAMVALWANMLLGLASIVYIVTAGLWRAVSRRGALVDDPLVSGLAVLISLKGLFEKWLTWTR